MTERSEEALDEGLGTEELEEDGLEAGTEESSAADGGGALGAGVEEEEGQEAEEDDGADERGVPLKNIKAEYDRKLREMREQMETRLRLIEQAALKGEKNKSSEKEIEAPPLFDDQLSEPTEEELTAAGFQKEHIDVMKRMAASLARKQIQSAVSKADRERRELAQMRQKAQQERNSAVMSAGQEFGDEFGNLIVQKPNGAWDWDRSSPLFKRANEIYTQTSELHGRTDGEAQAARKAYLELYREKYGRKAPAGKSKLNKAQKMMGAGVSGGGGTRRSVKNADGHFYRELNESEVLGLEPDDQREYLVQSVARGWNKPSKG